MRAIFERIRRRRAEGGAARVLALAGRAAGAERRGSVLVLIVGALAMLSVVTLVYFAIGRGDRRTAQVTKEKSQVDEVIGRFQSYLSDDIIGADALAMYVDGSDTRLVNATPPPPALPNPGGVIRYREAFDYPSTDRSMLSVPAAAQRYQKFNPVGTYSDKWTGPGMGGADPDRRVPSDPWLADAEPTNLDPTVGSLPGYVRPDWGKISMVAPSGNPVNLFNLRPEAGGFDALSGFTTTGINAQPIVNGMSDRLWLYDRAGLTSLTGQRPDSSKTLDFGSGNAQPGVPAHWDSRQKGAALPARDLRYGPGDERYAPYQWADADGDGVLDSRWFEMVDVSDPDAPLSLLPRDDRFRYFFAARIVDLSGRVNLNTASAFGTRGRADSRPSADFPAGLTPADVDLLHLLGMSDPYSRFGTAQPPGYNFLESPQNGPGNYAGYDANVTGGAGLLSYMAMRKSLRELVVPSATAGLGNTSLVLDSAEGRYQWFAQFAGQGDGAAFFSMGTGNPGELRRGGGFDAADLQELLTYNGANDPETLSRLEQAAGGGRSAPGVAAVPPNFGPMRDNRAAQYEREGLDNAEAGGRGNGVLDDDAFQKSILDPRQRSTTASGARPLAPGRIAEGDEASLDPASDEKVDAVEAVLRATDPTAYGSRDAGMLLRGYADALMPHSWRTGAWNYSAGTADPVTRTLSYGQDPILAAWTTGHMVANMIDMFDRDGDAVTTDKHMPTAFTMALVGDPAGLGAIDATSNPTNPLAQHPFWTPRPSSGTARPRMDGTLDLDWALDLRDTNNDPNPSPPSMPLQPSRLATQADLPPGMPPAVNIFGVEAQPFITEVGMLTIYTDARYDASWSGMGADEEWVAGTNPPPPAPPTPPEPKPVTIDGHIAENNRDFLCQVLAVQITNPFDCDIDLTGLDTTGYSTYYLEYGGNLFKIAKVDANGGTPTGVTLKGRDASGATRENTLTFYVMNDTLDNIADRWERARFTGAGGSAVSTTDVEDIIKNQLRITPPGGGAGVEPILISRMTTGGGLDPDFTNLLSGNTPQDMSVKLWRAIRSPNVEATEASANNRINDMLVDRITDPVVPTGTRPRPTLDRSLAATNEEIDGELCGPDPEDPAGGGADPMKNTGYSVAMWASFKRMDDPRDPGGVGHVPSGALPAYCIEAPAAWALSPAAFKNFESARHPVLDLDSVGSWSGGDPDQEYYTAESINGAANTGTDLIDGLSVTPVPDPVNKRCPSALRGTIREWPEEKGIPAGGPSETVPSNAAGTAYQAMYTEVALNDRNFENGATPPVTTLRVADLLLPLAVGPMCVPDPVAGTALYQQDASWLTLGEAMAVSLGYAAPPNTAAYARWRPLADLASQTRPTTDRGNLVLHDFVPFENNDGDATAAFNRTVDRRRSPGVPLALSILDRFRTLEPQFGSVAHATPGVVNLNTAPLAVLGTLPMLSPAWTANGTSNWWGSQLDPVTRLHALNTSDLAAGLMAYRDKTPVMNRRVLPITFANQAPAQQNLDYSFGWDGRAVTSAIDAVREAPGLLSLGEVACVVDPSATSVPPEDQAVFLADDQSTAAGATGGAGVSSILYRQRPLSVTAPNAVTEPNEIRDEFGEKVALLAGLGNTASVRSDVFAVWFIVHGYQRSDTEGLRAGDPLWPTISRRYVMVVDRSNVTRLGDKPRVLLCTEVPQ